MPIGQLLMYSFSCIFLVVGTVLGYEETFFDGEVATVFTEDGSLQKSVQRSQKHQIHYRVEGIIEMCLVAAYW